MTLPTSRQRPWIFPGQRAHMESLNTTVLTPVTHVPELLSGYDAWHEAKREDAHRMARAGLAENVSKDRYYLANPDKNWGENDIHRSRRRHGHKHLHGGVFTSKAGQQWGFNRLKERVNELNVRASAAFGTETAVPQPAKLPGVSGAEDKINTAFTTLYDSVQASEYTQFVPNANKILADLYAGGPTLGTTAIGDFIRYAADVKRDLVASLDQPGYVIGDEVLTRAKKRVIHTALPVMDRILRLLDLLAKTANMSPSERTLAMNAAKGRDVAEAKTRFDNTTAWTPVQLYQPGTPHPNIPGPNPPAGTPAAAAFRGVRNLDEYSGPATAQQAQRYIAHGYEGDAGDNSSASGSEESIPAPYWSSALTPAAQEEEANAGHLPAAFAGPSAERKARNTFQGQLSASDFSDLPETGWGRRHKKGGCGSCDGQLQGSGPGDGPIDSLPAAVAFEAEMGRKPQSQEELFQFMMRKNGKGKHSHKRVGRGKPRDTEASRLLKLLNDIEDSQTAGSKKKNAFLR